MFILSARMTWKKTAVVCLLIAGAVGVILTALFPGKTAQTAAGLQPGRTVRDGASRIGFLRSYGWEVDTEAAELKEVILPSDFSGEYQTYAALQAEQGFPLEEYRGRRVKRYLYRVKNFPAKPEHMMAELLVYRDQVIGGCIYDATAPTFMQGFAFPDQQSGEQKEE